MPAQIISLFAILCVLLISFPEKSNAACGEGRPARHRFAISWNGLSNTQRYNASARAFHEQIASSMNHHYLGQGLAVRPGQNVASAEPSWAPSENAGNNVTIIPATADGLRTAIRNFTNEVERLRETGVPADEIELVFYSTNHGSRALNGANPPTYGMNARPAQQEGVIPRGQVSAIWGDELRRIASTLPPGIRVKPIFSQCYGADTAESFLSGVNSPPACKCALSKAELGFPSWGVENQDRNSNWSRNWDHEVFSSLRKGNSLAHASMTGLLGYNWGQSPVGRVNPATGDFWHSTNGNLSSSQITLLSALKLHFAGQIPEIETWSHTEFLSHAHQLLHRVRSVNLSNEDRQILDARRLQRREWGIQMGIPGSLIDSEQERIRALTPDKEVITSFSMTRGFASGATGSQRERTEMRMRGARFLGLQSLLEETFFKTAAEQAKRDFSARTTCENDPILPPILQTRAPGENLPHRRRAQPKKNTHR